MLNYRSKKVWQFVHQLFKEVKNLLFFILKGGGEYSSVSIAKSKRQRVHQRNLSGYGIITDSATKEKLDEQIARLFYSCNLAFNIAVQYQYNTEQFFC
jgi:hypothetical protein